MFCVRSITLPIVSVSMPRTTTPAVFDALERHRVARARRASRRRPGDRERMPSSARPESREAAAGRGVDDDVRVVAQDLALQVGAEAAHDADDAESAHDETATPPMRAR